SQPRTHLGVGNRAVVVDQAPAGEVRVFDNECGHGCLPYRVQVMSIAVSGGRALGVTKAPVASEITATWTFPLSRLYWALAARPSVAAWYSRCASRRGCCARRGALNSIREAVAAGTPNPADGDALSKVGVPPASSSRPQPTTLDEPNR